MGCSRQGYRLGINMRQIPGPPIHSSNSHLFSRTAEVISSAHGSSVFITNAIARVKDVVTHVASDYRLADQRALATEEATGEHSRLRSTL